jgi:hypothetical protein
MAVLFIAYTTILASVMFTRRASWNTLAANFIQEELDSLRTLPYADLTNRSGGNFLGVTIQRGPWEIQNLNGDGRGNRAVLKSNPSAIVSETGLLVVPGNYRTNFTYSAKIKVAAGAPSGWGAGLAFRYRDAENHYRFRFSSGGIALDEIRGGASTTLWSQSATYNTDTWYILEVAAADNSFTLKKGTVLPLTTLTTFADTTPHAIGDLALISIGNAVISVDDVSVTEGAVTTSWNFEADALGSLPDSWQRMSWFDMPGGTGTLTLDSYLAETKMKQATVNITWSDGGSTRSVSGSTVLGN